MLRVKIVIAIIILALMSVPAWAQDQLRCEWGSGEQSYAEIIPAPPGSSYIAEIKIFNNLNFVPGNNISRCVLRLDDIEFEIITNSTPNTESDDRDRSILKPLNGAYYADPGDLFVPENNEMIAKVYQQVIG